MTHYQIITNEGLLNEFIEWLPELLPHETYYVALFARKKYCDALRYVHSDKNQCARFTSDKKHLKKRIRQLECPVGSYEIKGVEIPQEALALYITPNPRDMQRAAKNSLIRLANLVTEPYNNYHPHSEVITEIHKSCTRKIWLDFDFDNVAWIDVLEQVKAYLNEDALTLVKTRGGFHLLVELAKIKEEYKRIWHQSLSKVEGCDVRGDVQLPVVGCVQGDFTPHFINFKSKAKDI